MIVKSPDNLKLREEMIVKDTENRKNLRNWKEMIVKDTEKSVELKD